jgi:RNA polymerase sigma-70 factor (ECF subfamily)
MPCITATFADSRRDEGDADSAHFPPRRLDPKRASDQLDRLYRLAVVLCGSQHEAEDVVQDVYVRILSRPRFLRRGDDFAYLARCVRNEISNRRRRTRSQPVSVALLDDEPDHESVNASADDIMSARAVHEAIRALPESFRDVVVLVDVAGLSYREAADQLDIPVGTVMSRLYRGRRDVVRTVDPG